MAKDWQHQAREFAIGRDKRSRYLIWPMRSGKSKAVIDKACYQFGRNTIEGVIVIAPNGVHINWVQREIPLHAWPELGDHPTFAWSTPKRMENAANFMHFLQSDGFKWFAINMEALKHLACRKAVKQFMRACHSKFMLVVSEGHHFGYAGSKRTYFARSLAPHAKYVMIESGTPILNSPLRAFAQFEILHPQALGFETYKDFQKHFAEFVPMKRGNSGKTYQQLKRYLNMPELTTALAKWSSVVLRGDIHDMPDLIRTERPVVMSPLQRDAYLRMVSHHLVEIGDMEISASEGGARVQKLQQIINGYLMKDGVIGTIDEDAPIYDALIEQIDGTLPGKCLIWCRYKEDIRRIAAKLKARGHEFVEYHGDVPMVQREINRMRFLHEPKIMECLGTPNAGGEGLDFSAADAVIFFSSIPNARMVSQAEERGTVKGGHSVAVVRITTPGTIDDRNWEICDTNSKLADSVSGHGLRDLLLQTDV
jgi:hypothetical protein